MTCILLSRNYYVSNYEASSEKIFYKNTNLEGKVNRTEKIIKQKKKTDYFQCNERIINHAQKRKNRRETMQNYDKKHC